MGKNLKNVFLMRHGKSDWNANYNDDHERPLAKRGIKASKIMGQMLSTRNEIPDQIISSTALRARTTAELAAEKGKWDSVIKFEKNIYGNRATESFVQYRTWAAQDSSALNAFDTGVLLDTCVILSENFLLATTVQGAGQGTSRQYLRAPSDFCCYFVLF